MYQWCLSYLFLALLSGALGYGGYHTKLDGLARYMSLVFTGLFTLSFIYAIWQKRRNFNYFYRKDV